MIAYLRGAIKVVSFDGVNVEVNGVGYGVQMHVRDVSSLDIGQEVEVYITEVIREQSYDLYGFLSIEDKNFFDLLLKVSGVGPRIALAIMGIASKDEIASAIKSGDISLISSAPGIGKRLAERMIVELRDKVSADGLNTASVRSNHSQVEEALESLGFRPNDVKNMLSDVDSSLSVEDQIKQALKGR